jgi:hypothetical protein
VVTIAGSYRLVVAFGPIGLEVGRAITEQFRSMLV